LVDERLVDLEDGDREALQVRQRGVARAEVVERQVDAQVLQRPQPMLDGLAVLEQQPLSIGRWAGRL
jgi:hypothetical protein